ncbi:MAG TPA: ATP-binding protein [Bacillota bacterium]|nr:ATP-binding protein [Bacillota bacterium]HOL12420.1 ATP-binding protein [Bacillota bacterium]HPP61345.1 ATP-binding protein [Bacillota bacterium]
MDDFDFPLQPTVDEAKIRALANLDFLRSAENTLFLGPSRIGKTHLSIALGYKVLFITAQELTSQLYASFADATFQRELERLDKYLSLDKTASTHFFQVINQACKRQSVIITSNRPFQEWSGVFYSEYFQPSLKKLASNL